MIPIVDAVAHQRLREKILSRPLAKPRRRGNRRRACAILGGTGAAGTFPTSFVASKDTKSVRRSRAQERREDDRIAQVAVFVETELHALALAKQAVPAKHEINARVALVNVECLLEIVRLENVVGVEEKQHLGGRPRKSFVEAGQLSFIALGHNLDPWVATVSAGQQFSGPIGRTVIDNDDFIERDALPSACRPPHAQNRRSCNC